MTVDILPAKNGSAPQHPGEWITLAMPPDKSIMHRLLVIGSLTHTAFTIPIASLKSISHDIIATVLALESLGVPVDLFVDRIELQGVGMHAYKQPTHLIHCANSGTTARLLMGLLSGQNFAAMLIGDQSLSSRPMARLADLLRQMGARIMTAENGRLPAMVEGGPLKGQEFTLPVRSAQMKSALLIAGMHAEGKTILSNVSLTRDHTERMLPAFGYTIDEDDDTISIEGEQHFEIEDEVTYKVPGDISSAAFVIAAAVLLRRDLKINNISLNASRTRFLEIITLMGVDLEEENIVSEYNEERGTLMVHGSRVESLEPFQLSGDDVALLIDELPILSILAMYAHGESSFRDASELRVKESDRLKLLGEQLKAFGVDVQEHDDGLTIHGQPDRAIKQCKINHGGDHRLAMSFAIAALTAQETIHIEEANIASVSYPEFFEHLAKLAGTSRIRVHPTHADT